MALLPALGTCSYNGINFGSTAKSRISSKPLYDGADRAAVANLYRLSIDSIIQNDNGTDANVQTLDAALQQPGQQLLYSGIGIGNFSINVGGVSDVSWGPKPRALELRPIGGGQACAVHWECDFTIPRCPDATFAKALMAFNYEVDYSIDLGLTTRTISGYIEIPMTRIAGGNDMPDSVDAPGYFESVVPPIPSGFERKFPSRKVSADKRRLDFTIVDVELPCPGFPAGIIDAEGDHTTASESNNLFMYSSTLSATYVVAPGQPKSLARDAFFMLLLDRSSVSEKGLSRIFTSFRTTEGLYRNRRLSFSCSWRFLSNIINCVGDGGMLRTLPSTTWAAWTSSQGVKQAISPRGSASMSLAPSDDSIVDLCKATTPSTLKSGGTTTSKLSRGAFVVTPQIVDPTLSWVDADIRIIVDVNFNRARLKPLPDASVPTGGGIGEVSALTNNPNLAIGSINANGPVQPVPFAGVQTGGKLVSNIATTPAMNDAIQQRATPSYRVWIVGECYRAGYKVPIPQLTTVGGLTPQPRWQRSSEWSAANWSGIPVYGCEFSLEYLLDQPPDGAQVQVPGNPALFIAG